MYHRIVVSLICFLFQYNSMKELETEVNCYWREMPREDGSITASEAVSDEMFTGDSDKKPENLLTCQLARIASCLPIFFANKDDLGIRALCPQGGVKSVPPCYFGSNGSLGAQSS